MSQSPYDAILLLSFGGPEGMDDVLPFMRTVVRGRNIPEARLQEVAEHYRAFGGVSPINDQNRALQAALRAELTSPGPRLPVYWGNRNWHPFLADTLRQMQEDGVEHALTFVTSAYSSYSGCRQYREDIDAARAALGPTAPEITKLRSFFNHPGFVQPMIELTRAALQEVPVERRGAAVVAFTAHSIPMVMARASAYTTQLAETCRLIRDALELQDDSLVYQSRSGPPRVPWLEPDVCDHIKALAERGVRDLVLVPVGFISDHMEVINDLDLEAQAAARAVGINLVRAFTVGAHPRFVRMIRELILERTQGEPPRALGVLPPSPHGCAPGCCEWR